MKTYRYELIAVVFVLLGSILFSMFGIAEDELAETNAPAPAVGMVSMK